MRHEHEEVLRFWFQRGASGVRVDSAALLAKDPALADAAADDTSGYVDRDELHTVYRSWRAVADEYDGVLIGELWVPDPERFSRYLRPDELHTAFNFDFLSRPWDAAELRDSIDMTLAHHAPVGAPATWVLCNHDVTRTVTRYGRTDTTFAFASKRFGTPTDLALGTRRARAAALLSLALPGAVYLYQGEELGLPEAEVPPARIEDPMHFRSGGTDPGRDGCRVPLPWTQDGSSYGFGSAGEPWLPQPHGLGDVRRRAPGRRSRLDALALPRGAAPAPLGAGLRRRADALASRSPWRAGPCPGRGPGLRRQLRRSGRRAPAPCTSPAGQWPLGRRGATPAGHGGVAARVNGTPGRT